jgi:antibiotic biosynthesis monooxygenase (ABM) superfamily enzyme
MRETMIQRISGLEGWFSLPGRGPTPPPRWKMALLTGAVVWVLITVLLALATPLLASLVLPLRALVTAAVLVMLMTYVVMPRVSRLFAGWLYG